MHGHLRHRIVVSLLSPPSPPLGVATRLPIFTVTQYPVNPLPDFRPNVVRNETTKLLQVFQALVSARALRHPLLAMYLYTRTYDGRIHTRWMKLNWLLFRDFSPFFRSRSRRIARRSIVVEQWRQLRRECEAPRFRFARK